MLRFLSAARLQLFVRTLSPLEAMARETPSTWAELSAYAKAPNMEDPPGRAPGNSRMYVEYKAWLETQNVSNADYIRQYVEWGEDDHALEPCLVPYNVGQNIHHWILWSNDRTHSSCPEPVDVVSVLKRILPKLDPIDAVWYENLPVYKSIPEIRHLHVFLRTHENDNGEDSVSTQLQELHTEWLRRSPFLSR